MGGGAWSRRSKCECVCVFMWVCVWVVSVSVCVCVREYAQLRLVKAFKEMENKAKTSSKTLVRTGFRRKATVKRCVCRVCCVCCVCVCAGRLP